jgi:dTDP-glucose 4,6-dehydratase
MIKETIMVTGGAGFIGCNFVRYLLENEPEVTVLNVDALTYSGNLSSLVDCLDHDRHVFVRADITDRDRMAELFDEHDVIGVINFAAESHVDRSITDPGIFVRTNVLGTDVLLSEARRKGVRRFLQVSTDEVYGSLGAEGYFREDTSLSPNSPYSASKAGADHLVHAYHHTFGLDTVITRCSNNYGPYQFPEKMIPLMINNARNDRPLPVYGDGGNVRDWLFVVDHCAAIWAAYRNGRAGEVYNVGGNNERTNLQVVKRILECLGKPESLISFVKDRPGHDRRYAIDAGKMRRELGWSPTVQFESGIESTIQWYLDHSDWLEEVISGDYQNYYREMYQGR